MTIPQGMLAPCPFCGTMPLLTRALGLIFTIHCGNEACALRCEASGDNPEAVVKIWNTRQAAAPNQGREALEAARKYVEMDARNKKYPLAIETLAKIDAALAVTAVGVLLTDEMVLAGAKVGNAIAFEKKDDGEYLLPDSARESTINEVREVLTAALALTPAVAPDAGAGEDTGYDHEPTGHMYECPGCGIDIADPNEQHKPDCPRAVPPPPRAFEPPMREQIAQLICCTKGCVFKDTEQGCVALDPEHPGSLETADAIVAIVALSGGRA